jgi:hypothetical protein
MPRAQGALSWRFRRAEAGSGALGDLLSHVVDLMQYVVGPVAEVTALTSTVYTERPILPMGSATHFAVIEDGELGPVENEDYAAALVRFAGDAQGAGAVGTLEASRTVVGPQCGLAFELYGTEGSLVWNFEQMNELQVCLGRGGPHQGYTTVLGNAHLGDYGRFQPGPGNSMGYDDLKVTEAKKFLVAVVGGERRNCSVDDALSAAEVVAAAERPPPTAAGRRSPPSPVRPRPGGAGASWRSRRAGRPSSTGRPRRVSKSLVSLAMRGDPRVAESSRLRIEEAARELGYRTNWAARSLSTLRSGTVGVLVADLHNPWFVEIVDPLRTVLHDAGLDTLLTSAVMPGPRAGERARLDLGAVEALLSLKVEGLVVVGSLPDHSGLAAAVGDVPVVVAAGAGPGRADGSAATTRRGRAVVDHLVARGTSGSPTPAAPAARSPTSAAGYRAAMVRHGLPAGAGSSPATPPRRPATPGRCGCWRTATGRRPSRS